MTVTIDELEVADPADAWTRAGFTVDSGAEADAVCRVGGVRMRLIGRGRGVGIVGWSLRGLPSDAAVDELDGIPTTGRLSGADPRRRPSTRTASSRSTTSCCCHPTWVARSTR
jgi:hypothetical protein